MGQLEDDYKKEFEQLLREKTAELQKKLDEGDLNEAVVVIKALQDARDQSLYQEVGRLTRALHDAIHNFHIDHAVDGDPKTLSDMSDATDRLDYVVKMTERAANKTMDIVEETMPIAEKIGKDAQELHENWKKLIDREMTADEFRALYWHIDEFLKRLASESTNVYGNLSNILLAQDFQDLTGQVIQKVTSLVREVEASLVDLVFMASQVESITGIIYEEPSEVTAATPDAEGPQIHAEIQEDVVSSQDEVDDLLSSLGF